MARMLCLVTGCAGFIGFHVTQYLLDRGERVIGVDDLNAYYDVALKQARLAQLQGRARFEFHQIDVADPTAMTGLAGRHSDIDAIIHLAAQAGVRYSLTQPLAYVEANVKGQVVLLETARKLAKLTSLVYASSSSVYGASTKQPFSVEEPADHPVSLYAATKRAGELITESYCRLFKLPCTGLRFFTVYGPWGRPDMALVRFTRGILNDEPIEVFNYGHMIRDFTYIDDIVEGVVRVIDNVAVPDPNWSGADPDPARSYAPYRVFNIGNSRPVPLLEYIAAVEAALGRKADMELLPIQPGDVPSTMADVTELEAAVGFRPATTIREGISRFVDW